MSRSAVVIAAFIGFVLPFPAAAQNRPTVFLHGLAGEAADWAQTAERLRALVAVEPHIPGLPWRQTYEDQARELQSRADYQNLPASTVAIGHSNGGLVAREWSRHRRLDGIVTIGTPHQGAPIMARLRNWSSFNSVAPLLLNTVVEAFSLPSDWTWIYAEVVDLLKWTQSFSVWSTLGLAGALGLQAALPVGTEMLPQSAYLTTLNGFQNLAREATEVPNRVGIVSVAHNYYYGGPARAVAPEQADIIATSLYASAFGLLAWADYIFFEASPTDAAAFSQATTLMGVAGFLLAIDPTYCRMVSRFDMSECVPNDGIVPIDSQAFPNAPNILIGTENDGPAHTQERQMSDDALFMALTTFLHVPETTASNTPAPAPAPTPAPAPAPTPEPQPQPSPEPSPEPVSPQESVPSDQPSDSRGPVVIHEVLGSNQLLWPGDEVISQDGRRHLSYQGDGNLVIYDERWQPIWHTGTNGTRAGVVAMQTDGNLVMYDPEGQPIWDSGTNAYAGSFLAVQNDGNVVIYTPDGVPVWATNTF